MDRKRKEAKEFLKVIGMPKPQQADICCYVLLAMAGIKPDMQWKDATNEWIRIHDIIKFTNTNYGTAYAENSPNYRYRITGKAIELLIPIFKNF